MKRRKKKLKHLRKCKKTIRLFKVTKCEACGVAHFRFCLAFYVEKELSLSTEKKKNILHAISVSYYVLLFTSSLLVYVQFGFLQ